MEKPKLKHANLIMLSGGIDSAYLLWEQLKTTQTPIHAHHISLRTHQERRWDLEDAACNRIIPQLQQIRSFTVSASIIDTSMFPYPGWDSDTQLLMGARVAANLAAEKVTLMIGITKDDRERPIIVDRINRNVLPNMWEAMVESIDPHHRKRIDREISTPLAETTKAEILEKIPQELLDLTWSCRRPVREGATVRPCGHCQPCRLIKDCRS